jgi:glycine/D-amino acid oxidase-like deaminating enzyme
LEGEAEADVGIVGGGYTGLWTALALRRRDPTVRVRVLEAGRCGQGASGRNGGFLETYWTSLPRVLERLGAEGALRLARASEGAIEAVRSLGEDLWLRQAGMLLVSTSSAQDAAVERAVSVACDLGVPEEAQPLSAAEVAGRIRSPAFRRGVFFPKAATVQPARLVQALRRAALAAGVEIHERTPVRAIHPGLLVTRRARLACAEIVVATNAWAAAWRPLSRLVTPFGSAIVLTEPVPERLQEMGWTGGEAITDGRMFLHYFRTTKDGRVLMGSGSGPIGYGGRVGRLLQDRAAVARAEEGLRALLPGLDGARVERAWGGAIDVSPDHLPLVGTLPGTRIHYAVGYTGNGVGPSWLAGQALASLVLGQEDEWASLPLVGRRARKLPPRPLTFLGGSLVRAALLAVEDAEQGGRRPPAAARLVASLPRRLGLRVGTR